MIVKCASTITARTKVSIITSSNTNTTYSASSWVKVWCLNCFIVITKRNSITSVNKSIPNSRWERCSSNYDLMSSKCPFISVQSSDSVWNPDMDSDFQFIIKNLPQTLNYCQGCLSNRQHIRPVYMAWVNPFIPEEIASTLLVACDLDFDIRLIDIDIDWVSDVVENVDSSRASSLLWYLSTED